MTNKKAKNSIGVFGGTFDPPHLGHIYMAEQFMRELSLEKMIIIPTYIPPHKERSDISDGEDRLNMCRLAFSGDRYTVSDMEIKREGKSYSFDTLTTLKEEYPESELYLIIGSDMLLSFHSWYRYKEILSLCTLCVMTRERDISADMLREYGKNTLGLSENDIIIPALPPVEISSTQIRDAVRKNEDVSELLTPETVSYIRERGLYL